MHQTFKNQLNNGGLSHSYLLIGDEELCLGEINKLVDVLKITAADRHELLGSDLIAIETVRGLISKISLAPHSSKRVLVILPAHKLSPPAAQAILKTLEEPPSKALIMLYTLNERLVPATILSRCQRIYLGLSAKSGDKAAFKDILTMDMATRFGLAKELAENSEVLSILDQWLVEVYNIKDAKREIWLKQLMALKRRFQANVNARLQLEAFFYQLP